MNAELYFITEAGFTENDNNVAIAGIKKSLMDADIDVIYQTTIYPDVQKIEEAFLQTANSVENIDIVLMVGGLYNNESCVVKQFFKRHGINLSSPLPHNVNMLYSLEGVVPGYAVSNKGKYIIALPSLVDKITYLIDKYVVTYIMNNKDVDNDAQDKVLSEVKRSLKHMKERKMSDRIKSVFPHKGDTKKQIALKVILIICVLIFVASSYLLIDLLVIQPRRNSMLNSQIHNLYTVDNNVEKGDDGILKKFNDLRKINSDIKGWIYIPYTVVDYPVLQSGQADPSYYLYRDYNKDSNRYGSIFIESASDLSTSPRNIIMYGHHMNDGTMFAPLLKYSDLDFYRANPVITFDNIYEVGKWKIISVFKTNTLSSQGEVFKYLRSDLTSTGEFLNYVYNVRERSIIDTPVDITDSDRIITLSTCSYEFKNFRTVIVARKVREDESADVDIENAKLRANPLYPDCWYERYGGQKPVVSTFREALNAGKIDWYKKP